MRLGRSTAKPAASRHVGGTDIRPNTRLEAALNKVDICICVCAFTYVYAYYLFYLSFILPSRQIACYRPRVPRRHHSPQVMSAGDSMGSGDSKWPTSGALMVRRETKFGGVFVGVLPPQGPQACQRCVRRTRRQGRPEPDDRAWLAEGRAKSLIHHIQKWDSDAAYSAAKSVLGRIRHNAGVSKSKQGVQTAARQQNKQNYAA